NWLMGDVKSYLNEKAVDIDEFPIAAKRIAELIDLIDSGKVSHNLASQKLFPAMLIEDDSPAKIAEKNDWIQNSNEESIKTLIAEVFAENPAEFDRFKSGEKQLMGFFMGQLMRKSQGKADPKSASK